MNILVLGTFDGVHLGHKTLLEYGVKTGKTAVCSFILPPAAVFLGEKAITTASEKKTLLKQLGVDKVTLRDFEQIRDKTAEEYLAELINEYRPDQIVVGTDHRFGKDAVGDFHLLVKNEQKYNYKTVIMPPKTDKFGIISSSDIRKRIASGDIDNANLRLGHPYFMEGMVVHGKERGKKMGFPTINLQIFPEKLIPPEGVYATKVLIDGKYYSAMTNIGNNPTFNNDTVTVETHIFNLERDMYGKSVKIDFYKFVREEKKFDSFKQLMNQLDRDSLLINAFFNTKQRAEN